MSDSAEPRHPLVEVGRYRRIAEARERGLVAAARDLPHWIVRDGEEWVLKVEAPAQGEMLAELQAFESEERERPPGPRFLPAEAIQVLPLFTAAWITSVFFFIQNMAGERWMDRGEALSEAILKRGEWWRTITALTLHADLAHVAANVASGLIFAAFVQPHFGAGLAWFFILLSGALGNAVNAWGYRTELHASIGASTAVFGALGLLAGAELAARLSSPHTRSRWQLVLPIGAGLALLAYLGTGEEHSNVDFMAHLWGFAVGLPLGGGMRALRAKERMSPAGQRIAGVGTILLIGAAWWCAWR